jgi:hypothetical protein
MPTFYLENLNPGSTALDQAGEFGGAVTPQPATNSTTRVINVTTATAQAFFKFYMSDGRQGKSSGSNGTLEFDTPDTTRSDEFLQLLATEVFGSSESSDLFSNKSAIVSSWDTATGTTALDLLNGLINTAGADASLELVNAMFHTSNGTINRFTMSYGFIGSSSAPLVTGTDYVVTTGGSGSGAKVNVTMNSAVTYTITAADNKFTLNGHGFSNGDTVYFSSITTTTGFSINTTYYIVGVSGDDFQISATSGGAALVLSNGDGSAQKTSVKSITVHPGSTGADYAKNDVITITDGSGNTATITLNSYQAASLIAGTGAGTLSNNAGIEVPLETGDVIRVLYTITSIGTQEDTSGDTITATQTFFVDYTLN